MTQTTTRRIYLVDATHLSLFDKSYLVATVVDMETRELIGIHADIAPDPAQARALELAIEKAGAPDEISLDFTCAEDTEMVCMRHGIQIMRRNPYHTLSGRLSAEANAAARAMLFGEAT